MSERRRQLTHSRLLEALEYDPATGTFINRLRRGQWARPGEVAGGNGGTHRYARIGIDGARYEAHLLAWFYVHGQWPQHHIDHINGDHFDNRIANLRDVPVSVNLQNIRGPKSHNTAGALGVTYSTGKYRAKIGINGKTVHLGRYATLEEAAAAYLQAKRQHHEGCTI
jgi:hypothetical protein